MDVTDRIFDELAREVYESMSAKNQRGAIAEELPRTTTPREGAVKVSAAGGRGDGDEEDGGRALLGIGYSDSDGEEEEGTTKRPAAQGDVAKGDAADAASDIPISVASSSCPISSPPDEEKLATGAQTEIGAAVDAVHSAAGVVSHAPSSLKDEACVAHDTKPFTFAKNQK